jgi:hypothetical protein
MVGRHLSVEDDRRQALPVTGQSAEIVRGFDGRHPVTVDDRREAPPVSGRVRRLSVDWMGGIS